MQHCCAVTKLNSAQIVVVLVVCVIAGIVSADLVNAGTVKACPDGPDCYPWGAEGPSAGLWSYASKTNYLLRGMLQLTLTLGVGFCLFKSFASDQPVSSILRVSVGVAVLVIVFINFI